jgi:hypothetical protein
VCVKLSMSPSRRYAGNRGLAARVELVTAALLIMSNVAHAGSNLRSPTWVHADPCECLFLRSVTLPKPSLGHGGSSAAGGHAPWVRATSTCGERRRHEAVMGGEAERLAALGALDVLDSPPEAEFDLITKLAAQLFNVPVALLSLVDANRNGSSRATVSMSAKPIAASPFAVTPSSRKACSRSRTQPPTRVFRQHAGRERSAHPLLRRRAAHAPLRSPHRHIVPDRLQAAGAARARTARHAHPPFGARHRPARAAPPPRSRGDVQRTDEGHPRRDRVG